MRYRLRQEGHLSPGQIEIAIEEFRKYLLLILESNKPLGMISPIIDEVWHAFLLHTRDYQAFCQKAYGRFVHHRPNTPTTPASPEAISNFRTAYRNAFGDLHPIWTAHRGKQTCTGQCEADAECSDDGEPANCQDEADCSGAGQANW